MLGATPATARETLEIPFATCRGVSTAGQYAGQVKVTFDDWGVITPGSNQIDAFYCLSLNAPNFTCTGPAYSQPNFGQFRFSRASEGACTCSAECPGESHDVASAVLGLLPPFNPGHKYAVILDLGDGPPEHITFGVSDCGCFDNSGSISMVIRTCSSDTDCDDQNPCTADHCDITGGCSH